MDTTISGLKDPAIRLGSATIWNSTGEFCATATTADFAQTLNGYLSAASDLESDCVSVQFNISAMSEGCLRLSNLTIVYEYDAAVPDFAGALDDYLLLHQADRDGATPR